MKGSSIPQYEPRLFSVANNVLRAFIFPQQAAAPSAMGGRKTVEIHAAANIMNMYVCKCIITRRLLITAAARSV